MGELTVDCSVNDNIFLDSCLMQSYAITFEGNKHLISKNILNNPKCDKYISETVENEVILKKKKRIKLYGLFHRHLIKNRNVDTFIPKKGGLNLTKNDKIHLKNFKIELKKDLNDVIRQFNLIVNYYKTQICVAFKRIKEVISFDKNIIDNIIYWEKSLEKYADLHFPDSRIILEAYHWGEKMINPKFTSFDYKINNNKGKIVSFIRKYYFVDTVKLEITEPNKLC